MAARKWRPKGDPQRAKVHDFVIPDNGKATRYGVYDLRRDQGSVTVGVDHATAHFAVNAIRGWWNRIALNWHGRPLVSLAAVVNLIAATTTSSGLRCARRSTHAASLNL